VEYGRGELFCSSWDQIIPSKCTGNFIFLTVERNLTTALCSSFSGKCIFVAKASRIDIERRLTSASRSTFLPLY
jgi:hypothetical protein